MKTALAAIAAALLIAPAALAAQPSASSSANGSEQAGGSTYTHEDVSVSWSLEPNEYACAVTVSSDVMERNLPLAPSATSTVVGIAAQPGTTITVKLQTALVGPLTQPDDACFQLRTTASTSTIAAAPPAPPPPPPADPTTTTTAAPEPAPTATIDSLQAQIDELRRQLEALTSRVDRLEKAGEASWLAYQQAVAGGASDADAAGIARSTYLDALYAVGAFAPAL